MLPVRGSRAVKFRVEIGAVALAKSERVGCGEDIQTNRRCFGIEYRIRYSFCADSNVLKMWGDTQGVEGVGFENR